MTISNAGVLCGGLPLATLAMVATAQVYPPKPIQMIWPVQAGSARDTRL